jgi:hypothetical protein
MHQQTEFGSNFKNVIKKMRLNDNLDPIIKSVIILSPNFCLFKKFHGFLKIMKFFQPFAGVDSC